MLDRFGQGAGVSRMPRRLIAVMAACLLAATAGASPKEPEEGFDYELVQTAPGWPAVPGKVTVVESFWYQCPQCNALLPLIEYWARRNEERVNFVRVPLSLRAGFEDQEILYYALEEMGLLERLHIAIFEAIHVEHLPLRTLEEMAEFLEWHDVPSAKFLEVARSPAVKARHAASRALLAHYGIRTVPVIVVDGRYLTSASRIGGTHAESLLVADWLVKLAESETRSAMAAPAQRP